MWCRSQSSAPFSHDVGPPNAQWTTWWTSHQAAGAVHPAKTQCTSRASIARRIPTLAVRCSRPASIGSPSGPVMIRATPASQAMRRAVSAVIGPAKGSSANPRSAHSASRSMLTRTWGRSPRTSGSVPPFSACRHSSTSASPWRSA